MKDRITNFTIREEKLLKRARKAGLVLPERLAQWNTWIQDSELYLNELRNAVEDAEFVKEAHKLESEIDPETGKRAMKTIKITVTDADGVLLDRTEIETTANCKQISFRCLEGNLAERPDEHTLTIGQ